MRGLLELHYNEALKHSASSFLIGEETPSESHMECLKNVSEKFQITRECLWKSIKSTHLSRTFSLRPA